MDKIQQEKKLGIFDFLEMMYHSHQEYSLFAIKAPIDRVGKAFVEHFRNQKIYRTLNREIHIEKNILTRRVIMYEPIFYDGYPLIQTYNNDWIIMLREIFGLSAREVSIRDIDARILSDLLQTQLVTLSREDTSCDTGYTLFENGKLLEKFSDSSYEIFFDPSCNSDSCIFDYSFKSELREMPKIVNSSAELDRERDEKKSQKIYCAQNLTKDWKQNWDRQFINDFFCELGMYLPACYPVHDRNRPVLAVEPSSENTIVRADWVNIDGLDDIPF